MKYVKFTGGNGYCGCDFEEYMAFDDDITEEKINEIMDDLSFENAESYEHVGIGSWEDVWKSEEEREEYFEDAMCSGGWEFITKEEFEENS